MSNNEVATIKHLIEIQDFETAELLCFQLIDEQHFFEGYSFLGQIFFKLELFRLAVEFYNKAVQHSEGSSAEILYSLACAYEKVSGKKDKIIETLKLVIEADPTFWNAYTLLASHLRSEERLFEAIEWLNKAIALKPDLALAHSWLGYCYSDLHETEKAIACFQIVLHLQPNNSDAYEWLGLQKLEQDNLDEAIECFDKHLGFKNTNEQYWNKVHTVLLQGKYKEGWQLQGSHFWGSIDRLIREPHYKLWNGVDNLEGKKVLVRSSYGYGDTFQFVRFLPRLKALGCSVTLECQDDLRRVLSNCPGVDEVYNRCDNVNLEAFDYTVHLVGLPYLFQMDLCDIAVQAPYIFPDEFFVNHWKNKLVQYANKTKVGLVWSSGEAGQKKRNCHLSNFSQILNNENLHFISLQKGDKALQQIDELGFESKIINLSSEINNFEDTASIIANLDLVISVDTSVVHLAGALNKPTWTLIPTAPDWRWMLNRSDSPWYPNMKLYRQSQFGNWENVIKEIGRELEIIISKQQVAYFSAHQQITEEKKNKYAA
jgi:tetratricopeptide (TPR) repeat protein